MLVRSANVRLVATAHKHFSIIHHYYYLLVSEFTVVYCESANLIGYITVFYLLIVSSYASVHIAHHV